MHSIGDTSSSPYVSPTNTSVVPTANLADPPLTAAPQPVPAGPVELGYSPFAYTGSPAAANTGFADDVRGTDPQWTTDTDMSLLSQDVYQTDASGPIGEGGWTRVDDAALLEAGIDPTSLNDEETGFQAAIYTDGDGRYTVAYAGTDATSLTDWLQNARQGVGLDAEQYNQAIALGQQAVQAFGSENVVFTGHSLGGGLASAAALATGNPAVTFNAAGLGNETLDQLGISRDAAKEWGSDGNIRRYNVENDILTGAQQGSPLIPNAIGYEITLENPNFIEDPIRAHLSGTVVEAMQSRDIKSQESDGFIDRVLDYNVGGVSLEDVGETAEDVVDFLNPFN